MLEIEDAKTKGKKKLESSKNERKSHKKSLGFFLLLFTIIIMMIGN